MIKRLGSLGICAQLLSVSSWRNERQMFVLWIGNQDWSVLFLHNHRYNINICLLIEFWRFLDFLSEPQLARRLATPNGAMRKLRVNSSPASSWGWYITGLVHRNVSSVSRVLLSFGWRLVPILLIIKWGSIIYILRIKSCIKFVLKSYVQGRYYQI